MKKILKSFFCDSNGKFQPIYFFSTAFSCSILMAIALKFSGLKWISDTLVLGMMGYVVGILTLFNVFRKKAE